MGSPQATRASPATKIPTPRLRQVNTMMYRIAQSLWPLAPNAAPTRPASAPPQVTLTSAQRLATLQDERDAAIASCREALRRYRAAYKALDCAEAEAANQSGKSDGNAPALPSAAGVTLAQAQRIFDRAENTLALRREAVGETLCALGDAQYLSGNWDEAEITWLGLGGTVGQNAPSVSHFLTQPSLAWLVRRTANQRDQPAAQALTLMHRASAADDPEPLLAEAYAQASRTQAALGARLAVCRLNALDYVGAHSVAHSLPRANMALYVQGRVHIVSGEAAAAVTSLQQITRPWAQRYPVHFWLGFGLSQSGRESAANAHYCTAVEQHPHLPAVANLLAGSHLRLGEHEQAFTLFAQLLPQRDDPALRQLQASLAQTVAALRPSTDAILAPRVGLEPFTFAVAAAHVGEALFWADAGDVQRCRARLGPILAQRMDAPLIERLLSSVWHQPQKDAQTAEDMDVNEAISALDWVPKAAVLRSHSPLRHSL